MRGRRAGENKDSTSESATKSTKRGMYEKYTPKEKAETSCYSWYHGHNMASPCLAKLCSNHEIFNTKINNFANLECFTKFLCLENLELYGISSSATCPSSSSCADPTAPPLPFVAPSLPLINSTAQLDQPTIVAVNFGIVDDSIGLEDEEVRVVQLRVVDPDPSGFQVNLEPFAETEVAVLDNECKTHTQPSAFAFWEGSVCGEVCPVSPPYTCTPSVLPSPLQLYALDSSSWRILYLRQLEQWKYVLLHRQPQSAQSTSQWTHKMELPWVSLVTLLSA